ncbi:DUF11 domain-containing protein [bacterium]|nr:DUF11 domain-containing protein [bacterium]
MALSASATRGLLAALATCLAVLQSSFAQLPSNPLSATMQDHLQVDLNNNAQADPGDTLRYTIIIDNPGPTDATGVVLTINLDPNTTFVPGSLSSGVLAIDDHYAEVLTHTPYQVSAATGLLANDGSPAGAPLSVIGFSPSSTLGGAVQAASDGSFTYLPPAGGVNVTDRFLYLISDDLGNMAMATAELELIGPVVWYVNNAAAAGGNGTFYAPFDSLAPLNNAGSDVDGAGETIFVYEGNATYAGGLALEAGQELLGQGVDLVVGGRLMVMAAGRPTLTRAGGPCLVLAAGGNSVRGLNLDDVTGAGITGAALSGAYVLQQMAITRNAGDGVVLANSGAATLNLSDVSVETTAGRGVAVTGANLGLSGEVSGVIAVGGAGLDISGCAMDATFHLVAATQPAGMGLRLQNNSGTTRIQSLALNNGNDTGLHVSSAGTVHVAGDGNTIKTTNGVGLSVTGTTFVGRFQSISASNAAHGIVLSGISGGSLTVTGVGSSAGSGGTLENISQDGVLLTNVTDISLANMLVQVCADNGLEMNGVSRVILDNLSISNTGGHGVTGTGVSDLTLRNGCSVQFAGDGPGEDGLYFAAPGVNNLLGTVNVFDSAVSHFRNDGLSVSNLSGALVLTVSGSSFSDSASTPEGGSGILLLANGTNQSTLTVQGGCSFSNLRLDGVLARSNGDSSRVVTSVIGATIQNAAAGGGGGGINVGASGPSSARASLLARGNALSNLAGPAFVLLADDRAQLEATLGGTGQGNSMDGAAEGVFMRVDGSGAGTASGVALVRGNTMGALSGDGVEATARDGAVSLDLTLESNFMGGTGAVSGRAVALDARDQATIRSLLRLNETTSADTGIVLTSRGTANLQSILRANSINATLPGADGLSASTLDAGATLCLNLNATGAVDFRNTAPQGYRVTRDLGLGTFLVEGLVGAPPFSDAAVEALLEANNSGDATVDGNNNFGTGACTTPALPAP